MCFGENGFKEVTAKVKKKKNTVLYNWFRYFLLYLTITIFLSLFLRIFFFLIQDGFQFFVSYKPILCFPRRAYFIERIYFYLLEQTHLQTEAVINNNMIFSIQPAMTQNKYYFKYRKESRFNTFTTLLQKVCLPTFPLTQWPVDTSNY